MGFMSACTATGLKQAFLDLCVHLQYVQYKYHLEQACVVPNVTDTVSVSRIYYPGTLRFYLFLI